MKLSRTEQGYAGIMPLPTYGELMVAADIPSALVPAVAVYAGLETFLKSKRVLQKKHAEEFEKQRSAKYLLSTLRSYIERLSAEELPT